MGVFTKLFKGPRSNSDSNLNQRSPDRNEATPPAPPIRPLWALATEPDFTSRSRHHHHTVAGTGAQERRRHFGPRDPRPHPSTLTGPDHGDMVLAARVQQLGLDDRSSPTRSRQDRPLAPPHSTRPPMSQQAQTHLYSHRPADSSSQDPFPAYPLYQVSPAPRSRLDKPLPSPSHSPDRPRPRPTPPSVPSRPLEKPGWIVSDQLAPRTEATPPIQANPAPIPSPRRKNPPPVVIEISSSSSSSSTAEFTDDESGEQDSSVDFATTPSSSPSTASINRSSRRRRKTPSPSKRAPSSSPPKQTRQSANKILSSERRHSPASERSSPSKSTLSTPTSRTTRAAPSSKRTSRTPTPSPATSPSKPRSNTPKVQCHGLTSTGKRCTRMATPVSPRRDRDVRSQDMENEDGDEEEEEEPTYCHQHTKTSLVQTGCFVRSNVDQGKSREIWINYSGTFSPALIPKVLLQLAGTSCGDSR